MNRTAYTFLVEWLEKDKSKPLVIRGARQIGKTYLVRQFAHRHFDQLIELNFERKPELRELFKSNDPKIIVESIEAVFNTTINSSTSLLFLDEIQAAPELLAKLRWFAEELTDLHIIAAGSLLEFTLADYEYSMPVGRINYLHLEPLSFEEFLQARGEQKLYQWLETFHFDKTVPEPIHKKFMALVKEFLIVGGLPEAVMNWCEKRSLKDVNEIHNNLISTYRDDFSKYAQRVSVEHLESVLQGVPRLLGKKFVYTHINPDVQSIALKKALNLLCKARVCHRVHCCHADGLPLAAGIRHKAFKVIMLDCGLAMALLGLQTQGMTALKAIEFSNLGGVTEQLAGQLLRTIQPGYIEPNLFYWMRENKSASAEIDYIIQYGKHFIPVEVKAGATGALRSLHYFAAKKQTNYAIRINGDYPSLTDVSVKTTTGEPVSYTLLSIPFYLVGRLPHLLARLINP